MYRPGFCEHPGVKAVLQNNDMRREYGDVSFTPTNEIQVCELMLDLNARKTTGYDLIPPCLIKESSRAISGPVASIINTAIAQCRWPSKWKKDQVTPLLKKDEHTDKRNYRPVTVLPCLKNIFERIVSLQLQDFHKGLLSQFTSAYRRHHSCETSLLRITENWRASRDNKELATKCFIISSLAVLSSTQRKERGHFTYHM